MKHHHFFYRLHITVSVEQKFCVFQVLLDSLKWGGGGGNDCLAHKWVQYMNKAIHIKRNYFRSLEINNFLRTFNISLFKLIESGRSMHLPKGTTIQRLFVTNGHQEGLTGKCLFFLRSRPGVALNARNMTDVSNLVPRWLIIIVVIPFSI